MLNWIEQFCRDVRFAVRGLARTPGFTALAVTSLALGIMATTTIYSVLHAVVLATRMLADGSRSSRSCCREFARRPA
jgi:hypothetical protein